MEIDVAVDRTDPEFTSVLDVLHVRACPLEGFGNMRELIVEAAGSTAARDSVSSNCWIAMIVLSSPFSAFLAGNEPAEGKLTDCATPTTRLTRKLWLLDVSVSLVDVIVNVPVDEGNGPTTAYLVEE